MMPEKKLITIPHNGPIFPKAGIQGPVETPYLETTETIIGLLLGRYPVVEHVGDKTIELTIQNYKNDFSVQAEGVAPKEEAPKTVVPPAGDTPKVVEPQQPQQPQLSKAERKKLEQERRKQAQQQQDDSQKPDVTL